MINYLRSKLNTIFPGIDTREDEFDKQYRIVTQVLYDEHTLEHERTFELQQRRSFTWVTKKHGLRSQQEALDYYFKLIEVEQLKEQSQPKIIFIKKP